MTFVNTPPSRTVDSFWDLEIPNTWGLSLLKYEASIFAGGTPDRHNEDYWMDGDIPWLNSGAVNQWIVREPSEHITLEGLRNSSARWVPPGAILMALAGQGKTKGMVALLEIPATCNQSMAAIVPSGKLNSRFLLWWLSANYDRIRNMAGGEHRDGLNLEMVGNIPCPIPPIEQQETIECFLFEAIGDIDALIASKQRLLDLLAEKRRASAAEAIMRGLNSGRPLRSSGIDWLGNIPAHWDIQRARWLFRERDERSDTGAEEMLTVSHLTGVTPRSEKDVNMFEAETTVGYKLCLAGDLAINTLWAWMGAMGTARVDGIVSPAYNVYTPDQRLLPDYVDALVRIPIFAQEVTRYSKGVWSSRLRLYPEGFFETFWPVPPLDEQHEIVRHIAAETAEIDRLRGATEHSIRLLKERRSALIAAAVTGQLDISEAA
jgi:type I restriction enzyme S subunit